MTTKLFHGLLNRTMSLLDDYKRCNGSILAKAGSAKVEEIVLEHVKMAITDLGIDTAIDDVKYKKGGHGFPDIVICFKNGKKYGIEVKSSIDKKNSWRIAGNSAKGQTLESNLTEIYIIVCKTPLEVQEFRCREYSECVRSIEADHSPRHQLDMELPKGKSFFDEMGVSFKKFIYSDDPIQLVQKYYANVGKKAWWLPPTLDCLSDLSYERKAELISYGMVYYTEIFSGGNKKYYRFSNWLATEQSVLALNLRDYFSAKGQVDLKTQKGIYHDLPHFFIVVYDNREVIQKILDMAQVDELIKHWHYCMSKPRNTLKSKINAWIVEVSENIKINPGIMKKLKNVGITDPKTIIEEIFT